MQYFYDQQIRRYLSQFMRIFGNITVMTGINEDGVAASVRVPIRYADMQRQVAHLITNNSENIMKSAPFMTCYIQNIAVDRNRTGPSTYVSKNAVNERFFDEETEQYTDAVGERYSINRIHPVPYTLTLQLDIWTSNTNQKLQLMEQIMSIFNPSLVLQLSNNVFDWTRLAVVELTDTTWSSRSIPQGADVNIDIATMNFTTPIFINPPAEIMHQRIIHQIITDVHTLDPDDDLTIIQSAYDFFSDGELSRQIITPDMAHVEINNGIATLYDDNGNLLEWLPYVQELGVFTDNYTQIRLKAIDADIEDSTYDIVGTVAMTATPSELAYTVDVDTLPGNDFVIAAIIDPHSAGTSSLPAPSLNQKYLITDDITASDAWGGVVASKNDIINWNGSDWVVAFDASANIGYTNIYVSNSFTGDQLRWYKTEWISNYFGTYAPGYWKIVF